MMHFRCIILTFILSTVSGSKIWLDDTGGYNGILIAVDDTVKIQDCYDFKKKIETLSDAFSTQLWHATNERLHVSSMDVVIPKGIQKYCDVETDVAVNENWNTADIKISNDWSLYEQWTPERSSGVGVQQPLGCGQPGDHISLNATTFSRIPISADSLQSNGVSISNDSVNLHVLGQSLAMGWAQYRWGVFEETPQNTNHTANYEDPSDSFGEESSLFKISTNGNAQLCNSETHNFEVRNQQNIVCGGRSAWSVMEEHSDFRSSFNKIYESPTKMHYAEDKSENMPSEHVNTISNDDSPSEEIPGEISANFDLVVVKRDKRSSDISEISRGINPRFAMRNVLTEEETDIPTLPKPVIRLLTSPQKVVILSLDLSSPSIAQASVEWLRGGIHRWLFGIGHGVNIAVLASYSNSSFTLSLGPLTPGPAFSHQLEQHLALLPFQHEIDDNVYGGSYCLSCIIKESNKILKTAHVEPKSSVLVVAACQPDLPDLHDVDVNANEIPIHTIAMCPTTPLDLDRIPRTKGSWALSPPTNDDESAVETQFGRILTHITKEELLWPGDSQLIIVQEEKRLLRESDVEKIGPYRRVRGKTTLDASAAPRMIILTTSSPAKVVELWSRGRLIPLKRDTPRRYWVLLDQGINDLSYSFKFLSTSLDLPLSVTTGIYERSQSNGLNIRLRTSSSHYSPESGNSLSVWAEVTSNGRRVLNADVSLSLTYLGPTPSTYSLRLLDDGSTEPDMRKNDGVYSRYMTWTPGVGRYVLKATASSTPTTVTRQYQNASPVSARTGHFSTTSTSVSLLVENIARNDIYPPSRITDLSAVQTAENLVYLSWTAPGGDLDQGSAYQYELKMYTEHDVFEQDRFEASGIEVFCVQGTEKGPSPAPALFGTKQECNASIPFSNLKWYFAMRAIDGANNTGRMSNIVSVFVSAPETTEAGIDSMETMIPGGDLPRTNISSVYLSEAGSWKAYGLIILIVVLVCMLVVIVCACICCCRGSEPKEGKEDRPIYKIYVNNAYIQEEDGEIKVMGKNKVVEDKDHTQQWINSLDGGKDIEHNDSLNQSKFSKPVRFGVLTNGSIMREPPASSPSSGSKPSDDTTTDDFKYKDLSETISNSTTEEGLSSSNNSTDNAPTVEKVQNSLQNSYDHSSPVIVDAHMKAYMNVEAAYPPLGIPPISDLTCYPVVPGTVHPDLSSDDEGGFRRACGIPSLHSTRNNNTQFASCRNHFHPSEEHNTSSSSKGTANSHGTVRSVKKKRHISFV